MVMLEAKILCDIWWKSATNRLTSLLKLSKSVWSSVKFISDQFKTLRDIRSTSIISNEATIRMGIKYMTEQSP